MFKDGDLVVCKVTRYYEYEDRAEPPLAGVTKRTPVWMLGTYTSEHRRYNTYNEVVLKQPPSVDPNAEYSLCLTDTYTIMRPEDAPPRIRALAVARIVAEAAGITEAGK